MEFGVSDLSEEFQKMIKTIDKMGDEAMEDGLDCIYEAGKIIAEEQKRLISKYYPTLANLIKVVNTFTNKKGQFKVRIGYSAHAIEIHPEGVIIEFGRPGAKRTDAKMKQKRNEKEVDVKIGKFKFGSINHIRQGFDNALEKANQCVLEKLEEVLKEWGSTN